MDSLDKQLYALIDAHVNALSSLAHSPEGWLPHIVYVEEEGLDGYPEYVRYNLLDIHTDGTCTLANAQTKEKFTNRHLSEINIDWLNTVLRRYHECCAEHSD